MADEARARRLGRGLAALIGDAGEGDGPAPPPRPQRRLAVDALVPNPRNPRRRFVDAELDELTESVREKGVVQPILVRPAPGAKGSFEIIAGERRWRAAQRAGVHDVPVVVLEATDREALEIAIVENVQRADLNAMEEAMGYDALARDYGHSQGELARIIGKSRSHIANTLRLLKLPEEVREALADGRLSAGQARPLVGLPDAAALARRIAERGLSAREAEELARRAAEGGGAARRKSRAAVRDPNTIAFEKELTEALGLVVSVNHAGPGGSVTIRYRDLEQLDAIGRRLKGERPAKAAR
jgi:ParB family chromosome partitioning protein